MIHVHSGDVAALLVRRSGVQGEHHPFRESLVAGPVPSGVDLETRARFLSEAYDHKLLRVRNDLLEQERTLAAAADGDDEIVLWFEHDLFCLVNLLSLLDRLRAHARLSLVWSREPLASSTAADMPALFESRVVVTPPMRAAAALAWSAYTSADPNSLNALIRSDSYDFPFLREGLMLHASRFPSVRNGLGSLENRALALIASGVSDFITLFARIDESHPRFGFGDTEVLRDLRAMAWCAVPVITIAEVPESVPPRMLFGLTAEAAAAMEGSADFLTGNGPDSWLGGVHLTKENLWRWDEAARQIVWNRPAG